MIWFLVLLNYTNVFIIFKFVVNQFTTLVNDLLTGWLFVLFIVISLPIKASYLEIQQIKYNYLYWPSGNCWRAFYAIADVDAGLCF